MHSDREPLIIRIRTYVRPNNLEHMGMVIILKLQLLFYKPVFHYYRIQFVFNIGFQEFNKYRIYSKYKYMMIDVDVVSAGNGQETRKFILGINSMSSTGRKFNWEAHQTLISDCIIILLRDFKYYTVTNIGVVSLVQQ